MTTYPLRCTEHTRVAGWMSALIATATFSYLQDAYERIPLLVPIMFEDGNPIQFAYKSPELVYLPFGLQMALGVIFAAVVALLIHRTVTPAGEQRRARRRWPPSTPPKAWRCWRWCGSRFQAVNAWRLATLWRRTFDGNIELYTLALITALMATVVVGGAGGAQGAGVGGRGRLLARPGRGPAPALGHGRAGGAAGRWHRRAALPAGRRVGGAEADLSPGTPRREVRARE